MKPHVHFSAQSIMLTLDEMPFSGAFLLRHISSIGLSAVEISQEYGDEQSPQ